MYSHYLLTWDQHILHSLTQLTVVQPQTQVSLRPLEFQYIVFFILPQFRNTYWAPNIFRTRDTCGAEYQSLLNVSYILERHDGDSRYDHLLREFFGDPSRSGPFYLDGNIYACFAITFTKFLMARYVYMNPQVCLFFSLINTVKHIGITICLSSPFYCQRHPIQKNLQVS